jgi:hypothetical protein
LEFRRIFLVSLHLMISTLLSRIAEDLPVACLTEGSSCLMFRSSLCCFKSVSRYNAFS